MYSTSPTVDPNGYTTAASSGAVTAFVAIYVIVVVVLGLILIVSLWKLFRKAGRPGWAAIIPLYNTYTLVKICGRPGWWVILFFIPLVNVVIGIILALDTAKVFGKSPTFAVIGLILFPYVGYPMLAFGSSQYVGPGGGQPFSPTPALPNEPSVMPGAPAVPGSAAAPTPPAPPVPSPPVAPPAAPQPTLPPTPTPPPAMPGPSSMDGISSTPPPQPPSDQPPA